MKCASQCSPSLGMGNQDLCWNGSACWHLATGKCFFRHSWEEEREARCRREERSRVQEERRRVEEDKIATEALKHVPDLPEELKIYILHFFSPKRLLKLELPTDMLRVVLQVVILTSFYLQSHFLFQFSFHHLSPHSLVCPGPGGGGHGGGGEEELEAPAGAQHLRGGRPGGGGRPHCPRGQDRPHA